MHVVVIVQAVLLCPVAYWEYKQHTKYEQEYKLEGALF